MCVFRRPSVMSVHIRPWVLGPVGSPPLSSTVTFASIVEEEKQQQAALIRSREKPLALIQVSPPCLCTLCILPQMYEEPQKQRWSPTRVLPLIPASLSSLFVKDELISAFCCQQSLLKIYSPLLTRFYCCSRRSKSGPSRTCCCFITRMKTQMSW